MKHETEMINHGNKESSLIFLPLRLNMSVYPQSIDNSYQNDRSTSTATLTAEIYALHKPFIGGINPFKKVPRPRRANVIQVPPNSICLPGLTR